HHPRWDRWFTFMLGMGPRISGCRKIEPEKDIEFDVEGEPRFIWIIQKTKGINKRRVKLPVLLQETRDAIKDQLKEDGCWWTQDESRFRDVLYEACKKAHIAPRSPHKLRHTLAPVRLGAG